MHELLGREIKSFSQLHARPIRSWVVLVPRRGDKIHIKIKNYVIGLIVNSWPLDNEVSIVWEIVPASPNLPCRQFFNEFSFEMALEKRRFYRPSAYIREYLDLFYRD